MNKTLPSPSMSASLIISSTSSLLSFSPSVLITMVSSSHVMYLPKYPINQCCVSLLVFYMPV